MTRFEFYMAAKQLQTEAESKGWIVPAFRARTGPRALLRCPEGIVVKIDLAQHGLEDMRAGLEAAQRKAGT